MKKALKSILCIFMTALLFCTACSKDENGGKASGIPLSEFEALIEKISVQIDFEKTEQDDVTTVYSGEGLEYRVKCSDNDFIISVSVITENADTEYLKKVNYHDTEKINPMLPPEQQATINGIRYCAMPLTVLCELQGEDAIDTVLDATSATTKENGWELSFNNTENTLVFDIVYKG